MLLIATLLQMISFANASDTIHLTGAQLFAEMSSDEKQSLVQSLEENNLNVQNFSDLKIEIDLDHASAAIIADDEPKAKIVRKWFFQGGVSYLFPIGFGVNTEFGMLNRNEQKLVGLEISAHTTGKFQYGSVQSYDVSPRIHLWDGRLNAGPVFQLLQVNNPHLYGKQNFYYGAAGFSLGYEFTKVYRRTGFNIGIFGQVTAGGQNKTPTPFILVGGGIKIDIFRKSKGKK